MITATAQLRLPRADGTLERLRARRASPWPTHAAPPRTRVAYARPPTSWPIRWPAADPWLDAALDWDATLAYRRHLWDLGCRVAEAMDTAQRGMGLDWPTSRELIRRSLAEARAVGRGRAHRVRRGHRPARSRATLPLDAGGRRLRGAVRVRREAAAGGSS